MGIVEDPGVVALVFEFVSGWLGGHLSDNGEDAAFYARDEVSDVRVGAVDYVFGFYCSPGCGDFQIVFASMDLGNASVCFKEEV